MNALVLLFFSFMFQDPKVSSATTLNANGTISLTVTNQYYSPLVAYAYSESFVEGKHGISGEQFRDSALTPVKPVPPGQQVSMSCGGSNATDRECTFRAALFADGSIYGDPIWGQRIMSRRKYAALVLGDEIQDLLAVAQPASTDEVISILTASRDRHIANAGDQDLILLTRLYYGNGVHFLKVNSGATEAKVQRLIRSLQDAKSRAGG
jgi:hypothetical protein